MYDEIISISEAVGQISRTIICSNLSRMAMILGAAVRDLYGIRPQSLEKRLALARKHHNSLKILAHANSAFLAQDLNNIRILFRQQVFGAKLSHSHLVIVLFRPFLLHNPSSDDEINPVLREEHENNVLECLRAAMEMTDYLNAIFAVSQFFNGSWVSLGSEAARDEVS